MKLKYLGPRDQVLVEPYGRHWQDKVKEYPDDFAEALLATSVRQKFEAVGMPEQKETEPEEDDVMSAAKAAIAVGEVTKSGRPKVEAIEEMLGRDITAADRDEAWEKIESENR